MNEIDFNKLDFYGKLNFMGYTCWEKKKELEKIVNEYEARDYIDELMDKLIDHFAIFSKDDELNKAENFEKGFENFSVEMRDVMDIVPHIKSKNANYSYLISMLSTLLRIIEMNLPNNVRLARFLNRLLNCKEELARQLGIDEDEFANMIGKMLDNVDSVNDVLTGNSEKKQNKH